MNSDDLVFYKQRLNLKDANFSRIDHEDGMVALVYKITQSNGLPLILKICSRTGDFLRETYFLNHFKDQLPTPRVIKSLPLEDGEGGAILMEYLSGGLLKPDELTETLAYKIGNCLAIIHMNRTSGYGDPIQNILNHDPRVYFTSKFEEGLEECAQHLPSRLIEQCHRYYEANLGLLTSVDGPCVVHRDFRPGNLIVIMESYKES